LLFFSKGVFLRGMVVVSSVDEPTRVACGTVFYVCYLRGALTRRPRRVCERGHAHVPERSKTTIASTTQHAQIYKISQRRGAQEVRSDRRF